MIGIDNSPTMLDKTGEHASSTVRFEYGDIGGWTSPGDIDLVLAAASLHWVADHAGVIARWTAALRPGGQIAIQVPANADMPSHEVARLVAERQPYLSMFGADGPPIDPVQAYVLRPGGVRADPLRPRLTNVSTFGCRSTRMCCPAPDTSSSGYAEPC